MHMEGSDSDQVSRVTLHLGLTDYRSLAVTLSDCIKLRRLCIMINHHLILYYVVSYMI